MSLFKDAAGRLLCAAGLDALFRVINKRKLLILAYHGITKAPPDPACSWMVDLENFSIQMNWLSRHYRVLPVEEAVARLRAGVSLPDRSALLTFDDGYRSANILAEPILAALKLPATVFLVTSTLDRPEPLWHDRLFLALMHGDAKELDLRDYGGERYRFVSRGSRQSALADILLFLKTLPAAEKSEVLESIWSRLFSGPEQGSEAAPGAFILLTCEEVEAWRQSYILRAGAHAHHHEILTRLDPEAQAEEIRKSAERLNQLTGGRSHPFAYPNGQEGDFDENTKILLRDNGFSSAFTAIGGLNAAGEDLFALKRIVIESGLSLYRFRIRISGFAEWFRNYVLSPVSAAANRCRDALRILRRLAREKGLKHRTIILFQRAPARANPGRTAHARLKKFSFAPICIADLSRINARAFGEQQHRFQSMAEQRFNKGMQCFAMKLREQIAAYVWLDPGPSIYIEEAECRIDIGPGAAYLFDAFTFPGWRGRNLFPRLLDHVCDAHPDVQMMIAVETGNRSSRRGIEKAAFQPVEQRSITKIAGIPLRRSRRNIS